MQNKTWNVNESYRYRKAYKIKEDIKILVFEDYMVIYLENTKEFTIKYKRNISMLARLNQKHQ